MSLKDLAEDKKKSTSSCSKKSKTNKKKKKPGDTSRFEPRHDKDIAVGPELSEIGWAEKMMKRIESCSSTRDWSFLLADHIQWGNNSKVHKSVAIFNMNSAHDCPNRWTDNCQVGGDECYSVQDEKRYSWVLDYFRRQEFIWDCLTADEWADAFIEAISRKQNEVVAVKFSQAGDFRHDKDIEKVNRIAERLKPHGVRVFTYSASDYLDWSKATSDNFVVNQSNSLDDYGERRYIAVGGGDEIPEEAVRCPYNKHEEEGKPPSERIKCGECKMCLDDKAPDIFTVM